MPTLAVSAANAQAWLLRIYEAAQRANYRGTLVMADDGGVASSRVTHVVINGERYERIEWMDGEAGVMLRHEGEVITLWPRERMALVEPRDAHANFPALLSAAPAQVLQSYELRTVGSDRVAGFDAEVVVLRARDALRFSQRLWADKRSGLLLRAEILARNDAVLASSAFTELVLASKAPAQAVHEMTRALHGYRMVRSRVEPTQLASEGLRLSPLPAGFVDVGCARRASNPMEAGRGQMVQAVYSDGLSHVSVFIEPFDKTIHQSEGLASAGATHVLSQRVGARWVTLLGEVPVETLKLFAKALAPIKP